MKLIFKAMLVSLCVFSQSGVFALDNKSQDLLDESVTEVTEQKTSLLAINLASAEEIAEQLPGVGIKKAQAIVAYRAEHGPFNSPEELEAVKGVGPKLRAKVSDRIDFSVVSN